MPDAPANPPVFEQLDALAHVEVDRFCDKCAYNLRGQAVRRDSHTQLLLARCPECGTFHAANEAATALKPLAQRWSVLLQAGWFLICLYLLGLSLIGPVAVMVSSMQELHGYYYDPYIVYMMNMSQEQYIAEHRLWIQGASIVGSGAIGLVAVMLWTVIFPHWWSWGYRLMALVPPVLGVVALVGLIRINEIHWVPEEAEWLIVAMIAAHAVCGLVGSVIGRPAARWALALTLPEKQRAAFGYLWMVDGKKPPHAA